MQCLAPLWHRLFQEIGISQEGRTLWKIYGNHTCEALLNNSGQSVGLIHDALNNVVNIVSEGAPSWNKKTPSPYGFIPLYPLDPTLRGMAESLSWQDRAADPTGFIWMGARYYDPATGRFLSPDLG